MIESQKIHNETCITYIPSLYVHLCFLSLSNVTLGSVLLLRCVTATKMVDQVYRSRATKLDDPVDAAPPDLRIVMG